MRRPAAVFATLVVGLLARPTLAHPGSGIVVDAQGRVFIADTGEGVWRVDTDGKVSRQDGPAFHWMTMDAANGFGATRFAHLPSTDMRAVGRDPMLLLSSDFPVAVGTDGALYFAEPGADRRLEIVRLPPSGKRGVLTTLPLESEGEPLGWLNGIAAGADGSICYAENAAVRRIDAKGVVSTVARAIEVPDCQHIPGWDAKLGPFLRGLGVAADGTVYVAANGCRAVLRISTAGEVTPVLRSTPPWAPTGIAVHGGDVYVLEFTHDPGVEDRRDWVPRVRKLAADGTVSEVVRIVREPSR